MCFSGEAWCWIQTHYGEMGRGGYLSRTAVLGSHMMDGAHSNKMKHQICVSWVQRSQTAEPRWWTHRRWRQWAMPTDIFILLWNIQPNSEDTFNSFFFSTPRQAEHFTQTRHWMAQRDGSNLSHKPLNYSLKGYNHRIRHCYIMTGVGSSEEDYWPVWPTPAGW